MSNTRRSRFKRCPTGKHIQLTARDMAIFWWLHRYRFLRSTQLLAILLPKSPKRLIERLGDLYHETGLLERPKAQWRRFDARYCPVAYELSGKGIKYLSTYGDWPLRAVTFAVKQRGGVTPQFEHAMLIVRSLLKVELETRKDAKQRFVPVDEILSRLPETTNAAKQPLKIPVTIQSSSKLPRLQSPLKTHLIPDGLYGIEYLIEGKKKYRFYALECERSSPAWRSDPAKSSTALKQAAYDALLKCQAFKQQWGIPNLQLHLITDRNRA